MNKYEQWFLELQPYYGNGRSAHILSEADLAILEQSIGNSLPDGYRDYLKNFGGVSFRSQPIFTFVEGNNPNSEDALHAFYGVVPEEPLEDIEILYKDYRGRIPSTLLPIGEDACGNNICIGLTGERRGKIYFWDHEEEEMLPEDAPPDWEPGYSNVSFIANSFDEFFFSLKPQE